MITEIAAAFGLLTRLPLPALRNSAPLRRAAAWFPLAGLLVGATSGGVFLLGLWLRLPPAAAALVAIGGELLLTGALHPDGLADVADGWAQPTGAQRLAVMKDPRLGTYGTIALFFTLGWRWALIAALPAAATIQTLSIAHAVSRGAMVWTLARYPYARPEGGLGQVFSGAGRRELTLALVLTVAACGYFMGLPGLAMAGFGLAAGAGLSAAAARRLGGMTGDVCGAAGEAALLMSLAAAAASRPW